VGTAARSGGDRGLHLERRCDHLDRIPTMTSQIRPVLQDGAEVMDSIFGDGAER